MRLLVIDTFLTDTNSFRSLPWHFLPAIEGGKTFSCDKYYLTHSFITIEMGSFLGESYYFQKFPKRKHNFLLHVILISVYSWIWRLWVSIWNSIGLQIQNWYLYTIYAKCINQKKMKFFRISDDFEFLVLECFPNTINVSFLLYVSNRCIMLPCFRGV